MRSPAQEDSEDHAGRADFLGDFDFFGDMAEKKPKKVQKETEISRFRDLAPVPNTKDFNLLFWWKERREQYPKFSGLARSILGARPTSANVERGFSQGRNLVSPLRASMSSGRVEQWMFSKLNRK